MSKLGTLLRRLLARRGYLLSRPTPEVPPSVPAYLRALQRRASSPLSVLCFDNETFIQAEILDVFPEARVWFSCPLFEAESRAPSLASALPPRPSGRFAAVVDLETFPLETLVAKLTWLSQADAILLRGRLGSFWAGEIDLVDLVSRMSKLGFSLADVLDFPRLSYLQAPSGRALLACERQSENAASDVSRYRTKEALTFLSAPIARRGDFKLLAGRGSFGFAAGILNPGAINENGLTYLVARAEAAPWVLLKADESRFFKSTKPLLLTLDGRHRVTGADELSIDGLPDAAISRAEDFRLFRYRDQLFSNHAVISKPDGHSATKRPLRLEGLQTRIGISKLDLKKPGLEWRGFPALDRPLARTEKNWAMFSDGERLFLLYSLTPYLLLTAANWPGLEFASLLKSHLSLPFSGDGLPLRNSINPVSYDDRHWLHVVHKVYPDKQYSYWAVLIDKASLRPVLACPRPLAAGWQSCSASIIYVSSVIVSATDILLFAGLDDSSTAVAVIPRQRLDAEWISVVSSDA